MISQTKFRMWLTVLAAAPMTGRKRKLSAASEIGLGFRTPFKAPTVRGKGKDHVGVVSVSRR